MPTDQEWQNLISDCDTIPHVVAHSYRTLRFASFSAPVVLGCSDGEDYVVKAVSKPELCRAICNDQIMGRIAESLGAPVPPVAIVHIPKELIDGEPDLSSLPPGPAHGSRYMPNASKTREGIKFADLPSNRPRFALLAMMYGVAEVAVDHQFFYEDGTNLVWSFDHGHFFPGGPNWTTATLAASGPAVPDTTIVSGCSLLETELAEAAKQLEDVTSESIAFAVACPDNGWRLADDERIALAHHISTRADKLRS